ncbi:hypothetical protein G6038_11165 [Rhodococcus sp. 14C212]|uniref:hypothetical protein n=1 Tax=Rhodococcus sp. 14C212 TaxID=2711209 RepID=UPI0013ECAD26|nr:hypothetical protein [Rhodococcus sp. 14C212]NGP06023.1 hypothetical protein [Rhodococcus sp. 14C212]
MTLVPSLEVSTAISAWSMLATAIIALIAGIVALSQLCEARSNRRQAKDLAYDSARPYVVVYMEPSAATEQIIDLVIKNIGQTWASHVCVRISPHPQESSSDQGEGIKDVVIPTVIPFLAPGQEWRVFWDSGLTRKGSGLPDSHVAIATYSSSVKTHRDTFNLDWSIYQGRKWSNVLGVHDVATRMLDVKNSLNSFKAIMKDRMEVHTWDGQTQRVTLAEQREGDKKVVDDALRRAGVKNVGE